MLLVHKYISSTYLCTVSVYLTSCGAEFMDDDIREALFGESVEGGEFEELDDDFISQVAAAFPTAPLTSEHIAYIFI